ncbi:MAG: nucleoside hydrolase [Chitinophagaceae bacterium]|nr:nucleoside hydrolase [Chitinophagaceae bacterium]
MNTIKFLFAILLFSISCLSVSIAQSKHTKPVPIILDTDIGPDYDDVGAVAVLHALADKGEAKPLAIMASNKNKLVAPTINILNTYFGRPDLPIGAPKGAGDPDHGATQQWPELLVSKYPHTIRSTDEVPDAVALYRKILAAQPNKSVTIVTVGFLTNLAKLLDSKPDTYSKLSGRELVAKKVKQLVSMAGKFPSGREYNVFIDSAASAKVFLHWPTPVLYSGFEIGEKIITGKQLVSGNSIQNSPVKDAFAKAMSYGKNDANGRHSWDQTAVLVAVRGAAPYYDIQKGEIILKGGNNEWKNDPNGKQTYLVEKMPVEQVRAEIEALMMHQPVRKE